MARAGRPAGILGDAVMPKGYGVSGEEGCLKLLVALREMEAPLMRRYYGGGDIIYREGEEEGALYVLNEGIAKLSARYPRNPGSKSATVLMLKPRDVFGYPAFAGGRSRRVSAEAVTACGVVKVPRAFVERVVRRRAEVALEMATLLEVRLVEYEEVTECLLPRKVEVRLARMLPILARKFGARDEHGKETIGLRLTRNDLAAMTASTREAISTAVSGLRRRGILEIRNGRIVILEARKLVEIGDR